MQGVDFRVSTEYRLEDLSQSIRLEVKFDPEHFERNVPATAEQIRKTARHMAENMEAAIVDRMIAAVNNRAHRGIGVWTAITS